MKVSVAISSKDSAVVSLAPCNLLVLLHTMVPDSPNLGRWEDLGTSPITLTVTRTETQSGILDSLFCFLFVLVYYRSHVCWISSLFCKETSTFSHSVLWCINKIIHHHSLLFLLTTEDFFKAVRRTYLGNVVIVICKARTCSIRGQHASPKYWMNPMRLWVINCTSSRHAGTQLACAKISVVWEGT